MSSEMLSHYVYNFIEISSKKKKKNQGPYLGGLILTYYYSSYNIAENCLKLTFQVIF